MHHAHIRKKNLRPLDRLGYMIATGFGAGSAPVAPGTFGAAEGVVLFLIINAIVNNTLKLTPAWSLLSFAVINIALYAIGVWAAGRAIDVTETNDPSVVVIDEVSGQLIALTPLIIASWLGVSTGRHIRSIRALSLLRHLQALSDTQTRTPQRAGTV